jgi:hypothetical protein
MSRRSFLVHETPSSLDAARIWHAPIVRPSRREAEQFATLILDDYSQPRPVLLERWPPLPFVLGGERLGVDPGPFHGSYGWLDLNVLVRSRLARQQHGLRALDLTGLYGPADQSLELSHPDRGSLRA